MTLEEIINKARQFDEEYWKQEKIFDQHITEIRKSLTSAENKKDFGKISEIGIMLINMKSVLLRSKKEYLLKNNLSENDSQTRYDRYREEIDLLIKEVELFQKTDFPENGKRIGKTDEREVPINPYPEIFTNEGYELFQYLDENYTRDNQSLRAKYSWIFHYLVKEEMITCTKKLYIKFIKEKYRITFSRIQDPEYKYNNTINPLLRTLEVYFHENQKLK